jgi:putative PIN family toxin of toxin-antitoxin system
MIAVLDTNVLFSGLLGSQGFPGLIYRAWLDGVFTLVTSEEQIAELRTAARAPRAVSVIKPYRLGHTINRMRDSTVLFNVPRRHTALDPTDSFLLDLAASSEAHYLVTGDKKSGLLQLGKLGNTRILSPASFCTEVLKLQL